MTKVLTPKIEALTAYANGITGKNDTTLSDAVASLANGYGGENETDYDDVVLPSEYQRVEYIESSGTQFINLPYGFDVTDTISLRSSIDTSMGRDKFMVCPTRWNNNNNNRFGLCGLAFNSYLSYAFGAASTADTVYYLTYTNDGVMHDFYCEGRLFVITDIKHYGVGQASFGAETYPLRLFYQYHLHILHMILIMINMHPCVHKYS